MLIYFASAEPLLRSKKILSEPQFLGHYHTEILKAGNEHSGTRFHSIIQLPETLDESDVSSVTYYDCSTLTVTACTSDSNNIISTRTSWSSSDFEKNGNVYQFFWTPTNGPYNHIVTVINVDGNEISEESYICPPNSTPTPSTIFSQTGTCEIVGKCIQSPEHPSDYPANQDCDITTTVSGTFSVDFFELQFHTDCRWDYLQINDDKYCGLSSTATSSFAAGAYPGTTITMSSADTITFRSSYVNHEKGFKLCFNHNCVSDAKCDSITDPSTFCDAGNGLIASAASTYCASNACVKSDDEDTCCVPDATCDSITGTFCDAGNGLIAAATSTYCATNACVKSDDEDTCCVPAKCDSITGTFCDAGNGLIAAAASTYCAANACVKSDDEDTCCVPDATCDSITDPSAFCDAGNGLIAAAASTFCAANACVKSDDKDTCCQGAGTCLETCEWSDDGFCDDGGTNSAYSVCDLGTDCLDCGTRF
jgi:hypothetical protein